MSHRANVMLKVKNYISELKNMQPINQNNINSNFAASANLFDRFE